MGQVGVAPTNGFQLIDGSYLQAVQKGQNLFTVSGITALGTTQATSTPLPGNAAAYEVDTVGANTGVSVPFAFAGTEFSIYNASGTTMKIYPAIANNPNTAAQDTINSGTSFSGDLATHTLVYFVCAKDGVWGAK